MPAFDITTAKPIVEDAEGLPDPSHEFDINTATKITEPTENDDGWDAFSRAQIDAQLKKAMTTPMSDHQANFFAGAEMNKPSALESFITPYAEGVVGFFTRPFGYRPTLDRPFGLEKGPKTTGEQTQDKSMAESHPVAFTLGQIAAGVAPFIATAPLFPESLLGTIGTFETVGLTQEIGRQATQESLLQPIGEKTAQLGREALKSGILAPIWHYSGDLAFIGRPFASAIARATVRGGATGGLESVFGTDLTEALKQGGIITALSLIFESPMLAKTALGRGIVAQANRIASEKGFPEGQKTIDISKLDEKSARSGILDLVKGLYGLMKVKVERAALEPPKPQIEPPVGQGEAPAPTWTPGTPDQPMAGGMAARAPQNAPMFYSRMAAAIAEKMPENASKDQLQGILKSVGIPKEEIEWSGIDNFLAGKDKINKTELLQYLQDNQMNIEETIRGGNKTLNNIDAAQASEANQALEAAGWHMEVNPEDPNVIAFVGPEGPEMDMLDAADMAHFAEQENNAQLKALAEHAKAVEDIFYGRGNAPKLEWRPYMGNPGNGAVMARNGWLIQEIPERAGEYRIYRPNGQELSPGDYWTSIESAKSRAELEAAAATQPTKYERYTVPGGENYREMLLQIPNKKITKMVKKTVGGENRYNLTGLPEMQEIEVSFGKRGLWKGQGYKLPWAELSRRIPHGTFNLMKYLEETANVVWTEGYVFPYTVQKPRGSRKAQKIVISGEGNRPGLAGGSAKYQYVRDPGKLEGPGSTRIYINGKPYQVTDALPNHETVIPDYDQEREGATTTLVPVERPANPQFEGSHWDEKNVFAHLRLKDRTTVDGDKTLFVEEFQSDWNLKGRKEGFDRDKTSVKDKIEAIRPRVLEILNKNGKFGFDSNAEALASIINSDDWKQRWATNDPADTEVIDEYRNLTKKEWEYKGSVPYHPAVERWLEIALKRVLRYAAENGYDRLSWATGKQTADHYNLAKYVDEIRWNIIDKIDGENHVEINAYKDDVLHPIVSKVVHESEIEDLVGKDPASKIKQSIKDNHTHGELAGQDLQVGGHWAVNLYDVKVPNWLNDYAKKFGTQVEPVKIKGGVKVELEELRNRFNLEWYRLEWADLNPTISPDENMLGFADENGDIIPADELDASMGISQETIDVAKRMADYYERETQGTILQLSLPITPEMRQALLREGQPIFGKMPKDVGTPGKEAKPMQIFRMDEEAKIVNTKGEIVTLPKGEEYRTLPVMDKDNNVVPNKVRLQDGKQVTVYEGELNKLKGKMIAGQDQAIAGGMIHPMNEEDQLPAEKQPGDRYVGLAFRADTGFEEKNATAADVVRYESEELGNQDIETQAFASGIDLDAIPFKDVAWVTATPEEAQDYGPEVHEVDVSPYAKIIAFDGQGGYLIYNGDHPIDSFTEELPGINIEDFNQEMDPLKPEDIHVNLSLWDKLNQMQRELGQPIVRRGYTDEKGKKYPDGFSSGYRTIEYNEKLKKRYKNVADLSMHMDLDGAGSRAVDIPTKQLGLDQEKVLAAAQKVGLDVEDLSLTPNHVHVELPTDGSQTKLAEGSGQKPPKEPPKAPTEGGGTEGEPEKKKPGETRISKRKENMEKWNIPAVINGLMNSEKTFVAKYIDEGKTIQQIAKEIGEDIEDVKKTERWVYAHMEELYTAEEEAARQDIEDAMNEESQAVMKELKTYLTGKLNPKLKNEGEYSDLKFLPWLWAEEGKGYRPDEFADELAGMGYPIEATEADVIGLIKDYFKKEIEGRAERSVSAEYKKEATSIKNTLKKFAEKKPKKQKEQKPEREITGVGNGSVISGKDDTDHSERAKIFKGMPFALLGNKAEVLSRLPKSLKTAITQDIKKVFDLWGGAKGYRSGLFPDLPAADYSINELSDERSNYYKNIQDPEKVKLMKKTLDDIMSEFTDVMAEAFGLPAPKDDKEFMEMLNSWLKMGLRRERYFFAKEIIQDFGDRLLAEAKADKFASPESSAKYFFLENTSIFGLSADGWTQGIIRTTAGDSYIRDVLDKLIGLSEKIDNEAKRDAGMPVTQEDAWDAMDKVTAALTSGQLKPEETAILVDPQYLNPTQEEGTYSVGSQDNTWKGHKENLEKHLLPLIKTGAKVIYTNNADQDLIKWLQAHKLPYNIEQAIGAVADRRGRDEIISFIGFSFDPKWTVGQVQPGGTGAAGEGQQYVAARVTGQSDKFTEWLKQRELKQQQEIDKQAMMARIEEIAKSKMLSKVTISRVRKYLGIKELKNTTVPEVKKMVTYFEGLKTGDRLMTEKQIAVYKKLVGDIQDLAITPKRIAIERFGENEQLMTGLIAGKFPIELFPTVDIKQGHPTIIKVVDEINTMVEHADKNIRERDLRFQEMIEKAEKSRNKKLDSLRRFKRAFTSANTEIFMALSGEKVDLTREEVAVVAYLKNFFAKAKRDLGLEKYRKNYITHLEQPFMEKMMARGIIGAFKQYFHEQSLKKELDTNIMLELDNIIGSEKFFRFALQRKGGITPSMNIRKILHDYSSLYETKMALDKILPDGQVITKMVLQGKSAVWLKKYLQNLKGRGLDNEFRTGRSGWMVKIADWIVDIGYTKLLALNWRSAVKNIIAGETNAMIWQDFGTYLKGKQRFYSDPKKAYKLAVEHDVLEGTYADYAQRGIGRLKKIQDVSMIGQRLGEIEIRTTLFVSELSDEEWQTGNISDDRSRRIRDIVAITQGVFSKTESPLWVQSFLGRMIMQMNRWRITDAMLLRRIVNGARAEWTRKTFNGPNSQRLMKALLFYIIGMYASYELGRAGFKKLAQMAQSMAEVVDSTISLFSQGQLEKMITDNPTLTVVKEFLHSAQDMVAYIKVPGAQKPKDYKIEGGLDNTYIAPLNTVKEIIDSATP